MGHPAFIPFINHHSATGPTNRRHQNVPARQVRRRQAVPGPGGVRAQGSGKQFNRHIVLYAIFAAIFKAILGPILDKFSKPIELPPRSSTSASTPATSWAWCSRRTRSATATAGSWTTARRRASCRAGYSDPSGTQSPRRPSTPPRRRRPPRRHYGTRYSRHSDD